MSALQETELEALTLDRAAVLRLVSAVRLYRRAVAAAMARRWGDGAIDGAMSHRLERRAEAIENEEFGDVTIPDEELVPL